MGTTQQKHYNTSEHTQWVWMMDIGVQSSSQDLGRAATANAPTCSACRCTAAIIAPHHTIHTTLYSGRGCHLLLPPFHLQLLLRLPLACMPLPPATPRPWPVLQHTTHGHIASSSHNTWTTRHSTAHAAQKPRMVRRCMETYIASHNSSTMHHGMTGDQSRWGVLGLPSEYLQNQRSGGVLEPPDSLERLQG